MVGKNHKRLREMEMGRNVFTTQSVVSSILYMNGILKAVTNQPPTYVFPIELLDFPKYFLRYVG